ncbi:MAG: serine--tRNA ligase [Candidatus Bipolaricaulota bacterium]|nr:serine--tRNA ligase [Candidatus Bipolaricaulota bacterium]MDW8126788.1 serine--tRNA ligase [Candidatus Bipolaricaulota bacterium]
MLDLRRIRGDPEGVAARLKRRNPNIDLTRLLALDEERRELQREVDEIRRRQNEGSQRVAELTRGVDPALRERILSELKGLAEQRKQLEERLAQVEAALEEELLSLPNIPHDSVPSGTKEEKVVLRVWGEPPRFSFPPQHHVALAQRLGLLDLERAARISGSRFPLYTGDGAWLELTLLWWMFGLHVRDHGYTPVLPPILANRRSFLVSGQLPKFAEELYYCPADDLFLNPTAESLLANLHNDEILEEEQLPLRYVAYTPCFRREAGSYGEEQRGLIRVHQFNKIELFWYSTPQTSYQALEELVSHAERVLQLLGLHYRVTLLPATDLAFQSAKTVDLEVWLPGQGGYYEVSSCSNCEDFQARRGNVRYRPKAGGKPQYVHTLNGSGLATSRLFAAILEQNQRPDGTVVLPKVLAELLDQEVLG